MKQNCNHASAIGDAAARTVNSPGERRWPSPTRFLRRVVRRLQAEQGSLLGSHFCSVCGRRVGRFLTLQETHPSTAVNLQKYEFPYTFEMLNASQYSCPFCGATDRDRLYALHMDELLKKDHGKEGIRIVDFAPVRCLSAYIRRKLQNHPGTYRTADLFSPEVDDQVDLMDMRIYRDGQFDFFICSHVLEHVTDDRKAMRELYRVIRPGGSGIAMVPVAREAQRVDEDTSLTDQAERWRRFGQHDHVRLYSKPGLLERLRQAGFEVQELGVAHFGAETFDKLALSHGSILYVATHPA
jgi:hypothetical protein